MNIISLFQKKIIRSQILRNILLFLFLALIMILSLRGIPGNPTEEELNLAEWRDDGPFELSAERGKYALLYSWFENKTSSFSMPLAYFVLPDLAYGNGKYVSLFPPGLSFISIPGYLIGREFQLAQLGSFATVAIFAVANFFLIKPISVRSSASHTAGMIAGIIFLFATPAFAYSVTLYQHHITTFLILFSIYLLQRKSNFWALAAVWFMIAVSITVDSPNFFMMLPIGIYGLGRIIKIRTVENQIKVSLVLYRVLTFSAVVVPLALYMWFNQVSNGSPFKMSGTLSRVETIDEFGKPTNLSEVKSDNSKSPVDNKNLVNFFNTRYMVNGVYIHLFSPDRGMLVYTPVMFFSFFALYIAYKKKTQMFTLLASVMAMNMIIYAMWGDPNAGWAFGTRYLIPSYAIMAILISILLTYYRKNSLLLALFGIIAIYSILVNSLGAITSNKNPPKKEISGLERMSKKKEHYTYERNIEYLNSGIVKSFVYKTYAYRILTPWQYYISIATTISLFFVFSLLNLKLSNTAYEK